MDQHHFNRTRLLLATLTALAMSAVLTWEHVHGGVESHHLLQRADLPAISNWWGGLLIPLLTWFLVGRIRKRVVQHQITATEPERYPVSVLRGFAGALLYGTLLSVSFAMGSSLIPSYLFMSLPAFALFFPIFRSEYVLGFVLSMTLTFGAVLPTLIASIVALVAAVLYHYVRPSIVRATVWVVRPSASRL